MLFNEAVCEAAHNSSDMTVIKAHKVMATYIGALFIEHLHFA